MITVAGSVIALGASAVVAHGQAAALPASVSPLPLVAVWSGPYGGVPPWDHVKPENFPTAFEQGLAEERTDYRAIVANRQAPTFENTIVAMQRAGRATA